MRWEQKFIANWEQWLGDALNTALDIQQTKQRSTTQSYNERVIRYLDHAIGCANQISLLQRKEGYA